MARNADEQAQFEEAEKLRAAQSPFDPTVHGHGTIAPVAPGTVTEMYKLHKDLADRFEEMEQNASTVMSGVLNSLISRIEMLERKLQGAGQTAIDAVEGAKAVVESPFRHNMQKQKLEE